MKVPMPLSSSFLMKNIFFLTTVFNIVVTSQRPGCTKEVYITSDVSFTFANNTTLDLTTNIDLMGEIMLFDKICFYVKPELHEDIYQTYDVEIDGNYEELYPLVYELNLIDVTRIYPLYDQYTFVKPSLSFDCICDCPGGDEHCPEDTDRCVDNPEPMCVTVSVDTEATGCPLSLFSGSTTTCCSVTISQSGDDNQYIAYRLADSETSFTFTLYAFYTSDETVFEPPRQMTAMLISDGTIDDKDEPEIAITANKLDALDIPTSNLYSSVESGQVMSGVEVNAIDEWDFHKLGWFRVSDSTVTVEDPPRLEDVVDVNVTNCLVDEYSVTANVSFDGNDVKGWGSPLTYLSNGHVLLAFYDPEGMSAEIHYQISPRMTFKLPLNIQTESFYQVGESNFENFRVEPSDVGSKVIIKFTGTSGIISGDVQSGNDTDGYSILDDVHFIVPTSSDEISVTLAMLSTNETITRVCLHHISSPGDIICNNVGESTDSFQGKGKNAKWYIIAFVLVIVIVIVILFLFLRGRETLRTSPQTNII